MRQTKREEMEAWLVANPGKTERDWLLEVKCDDQHKTRLREVLDSCDKSGIEYKIPGEVHLVILEYDEAGMDNVYAAHNNSLRRDLLKLKERGIESIFFDIIFDNKYPYDMDFPEDLFDPSAKFYVVSTNISNWKALQTMPEEEWESDENRWFWLSGTIVSNFPLAPAPTPWYADNFIQIIK